MNALIVENEVYLAQSLSSKMGSLGYLCRVCHTSGEALGVLNSTDEPFSVALLCAGQINDEFYRLLERLKGVIVILMVNYISVESVARPIAAGASDYIQKPFIFDELMRKIGIFQTIKRLNDELNATKAALLESKISAGELDRVMSIEDFVRQTIERFQDHLSDTQIAAGLGISRKSLWDKRKKYGIQRPAK